MTALAARVRCFVGGHRWVTTITGLEPRDGGWTVTDSTTACHRCGTPRD